MKESNIEKLYRLLGEKVFSEFEAEFHYYSSIDDNETYPIEDLIECSGSLSLVSSFHWDETFEGYNYWEKIHFELVKNWVK